MLEGVAELLALDSGLRDDLKTAVSEACNNVVLHAYGGECGPLVVDLEAEAQGVEVIVRDRGGGIRSVAATQARVGVGLAVISALADRAEFRTGPEGGTEVRMSFRSAPGGAGAAAALEPGRAAGSALGGAADTGGFSSGRAAPRARRPP
jgi:serine/threonine-protein kinase RsbW